MNVPEKYRVTNHPIVGSDSSYGNNGFFILPHHRIADYFYNVQASDGNGWEHISVTLSRKEIVVRKKRKEYQTKQVQRCCTWEEMCYIKSSFWDEEDSVIQLHAPKSMWVNNHPYCLHLWKPLDKDIPLPDQIMVGLPSLNKTENQTA